MATEITSDAQYLIWSYFPAFGSTVLRIYTPGDLTLWHLLIAESIQQTTEPISWFLDSHRTDPDQIRGVGKIGDVQMATLTCLRDTEFYCLIPLEDWCPKEGQEVLLGQLIERMVMDLHRTEPGKARGYLHHYGLQLPPPQILLPPLIPPSRAEISNVLGRVLGGMADPQVLQEFNQIMVEADQNPTVVTVMDRLLPFFQNMIQELRSDQAGKI